MRANRRSLLAALLPFMLVSLVLPASAQKVAFDTPPAPREIKACVPAFDDALPPNAALFVALQRSALRPAGWAFRNPLSPADGDPGNIAADGLVLAAHPEYWRVELRDPDTEDARRLAGMDVIYLPVNGNLDLPPGPGRDGLIHAVENGALLWIDHVSGNVVDFAPPRVRAVDPGGASGSAPTVGRPFIFSAASPADPRRDAPDIHGELFNIPYQLEEWEIDRLGQPNGTIVWPHVDTSGWLHRTDVDFRLLLRLMDGGTEVGPTAMAARYGGGTILVTAGNVGGRVVGWLGQVWPGDDQRPALKFAYNAIAWHFQTRHGAPAGGGPTTPLARAPMDIKWQYPAPNRGGAALGPVFAAPLHFNSLVYVLATRGDGQARIVCLDPEPERDLSGDGSPDDGIPDPPDAEYDVLWEWVFDGALSPKSSAIVPARIGDTSAVLVSTSRVDASAGGASGQVWCFNADNGAPVWSGHSAAVLPYDDNAAVCDVSTPVVNNGFVYFAASEALTAGAADDVERTYGRVWALDLATGGELASDPDEGGARWVFPDPDLDREATGGTLGEPRRALPCFNDPLWVAAVGNGSGSELPPLPTGAPVITSGATLDGRLAPDDGTSVPRLRVDALLTVGTPVTHTAEWDEVNGEWGIEVEAWLDWDNRGGGSELALVPTPTSGTGSSGFGHRLNADYYGTRLNASAADFNAARRLADEADTYPLALPYNPTPADAAHFRSVNVTDSGARQFLANWAGADRADSHPLELMRGAEIEIQYEVDGDWEAYYLPGPVLWQRKYRPNEARMVGGVARGDVLYAVTIPPVEWGYPPVTAAAPHPERTSLIHVLDPESGAVRWRIDPRVALPTARDGALGARNAQAMILAPPAVDDGVLFTGVTMWPVGGGDDPPRRSAIVGLKDAARLQVRLGQTQALSDNVRIARQPGAVVMYLLETYDIAPAGAGPTKVVPADNYEIDYDARVIRVLPEQADDVGATATAGPDPIAGKAVVVEWLGTDGNTRSELHVFEPAHVFTYMPDFIRLEHYPVDLASVRVYLPTKSTPYGVPVRFPGGAYADAGEPTVQFNYGDGNRQLLPNGWLDMRDAFADVNNNGNLDVGTDWNLEPGTDVVITYTGFVGRTVDWSDSGAYGGTNGFVPIPNPGLGLAAERRQIPVYFGQSYTTPALAGGTILVGTEGFDPAWSDTILAPPGLGFTPPPHGLADDFPYGRAESLLALNWDRQSGRLWGRMFQPARVDMDGDGFDVSLDLDEGAAVVSAAAATVGHDAVVASRVWGTGAGYVSALRTERTLIAAGSRVVECMGAEPVREWVGSRDSETASRPFGHIAKAKRLDNGNILVVDSGNNRVFELDAQGRQAWPLTAGGAAITPTNAPAKMLLNRPTDAWRYYTWQYGVRWSHTVIADAGSNRIVHWVTKPASATDPAQSHEVYAVSPDAVPGARPGELLRLEYQTAQPILDPETGHLWGYLASAANWNRPLIVEPPRFDGAGNFYPARINPPGGAPILGARIGDQPFSGDPPTFDSGRLPSISAPSWGPWDVVYQLEFRNIRQVEFSRRANEAAFGTPEADARFWVVASRYFDNATSTWAPMGIYEFALDPTVPLTFYFSRDNYLASGQGTFTLPSGQLFHKDFFPTSAKRLATGDYLVANQAGAIDHLAVENTDMQAWGRVVGSEVFRVVRATKMVYGRHMIPDPRRPEWPEPLGMVSYAERF